MPAGQSPPRHVRLFATDCGGARREVAGEILSERCQCHSATRQAPRSPSLITGNGPIQTATPLGLTSVLPHDSLHRRKRLVTAYLYSSLMANIEWTCDTTTSLVLYCMVTAALPVRWRTPQATGSFGAHMPAPPPSAPY